MFQEGVVDLAERLEVKDFLGRLQGGDATCGWRGDPNCTVAREMDGTWSIYRNDDDGQWRRMLTSKPGARLGPEVLKMLASRDQHRARDPFDPVEASIAANKALYVKQDRELIEAHANNSDEVWSQATSAKRNRRYIKDRT